jgi:regulation of enolase protein 1 (concanavalin A-like superfamily)
MRRVTCVILLVATWLATSQCNFGSVLATTHFMIRPVSWVRLDERKWIKAGIEKSDGQCLLSSVLTIDRSDWATGTYDGNPADFWMRATVRDGVIRLQVSSDGQKWPLVRLAPFPKATSYLVGPMCCTPERAGLEVEFSTFQVMPPLGKDLHDLS